MSVSPARAANVKRFFAAGFMYAVKQARRERDRYLIEHMNRLQLEVLQIPDGDWRMRMALLCFEPGNTLVSDMEAVRHNFFGVRVLQCTRGADVLILFSALYGNTKETDHTSANQFCYNESEDARGQTKRKEQEAKKAAALERARRKELEALAAMQEQYTALIYTIRNNQIRGDGSLCLTDDQVRAIRNSTLDLNDLAQITGYTKKSLRRIYRRERYAHVPDLAPAHVPTDEALPVRTPRRSWRCKLTAEQVQEIKQSNEPIKVLGERYGVSGMTIYNVRMGKYYKHVEELEACA